ncbi:MAG TPA: hypothetical protein V6D18_10420 [Thermosynechococcaceae cyanobacterium]
MGFVNEADSGQFSDFSDAIERAKSEKSENWKTLLDMVDRH